MNDTTIPERSRVIATAVPRDVATSPGFHSAQGFELLQREARALVASSMVPAQFRQWNLDRDSGQLIENPEALSNCVIALNMALRMRADPLMVMQNLYVVHGTPAWSAKFLIGLFNTCGRFSTIRYAFNDKRDTCYAHCIELATGERIEGPSASVAMAKAEGWSERKGSKWRTMPEVMLTNRAAAFLIRTTAPELSLGLPMADEAQDVWDVETREVARPPSPLQTVRELLRDVPATIEAQAVPEPEPPPAPPADPQPDPETEAAPLPDRPFDPLPPRPPVIEPESLPLKDGDLTPQDTQRRSRQRVPTSPLPAFNAEAYARRIGAIADVDLLTLMREEIASLPPSTERDTLMKLIDSKTHELIAPEGEDHDHA